MNKAQQCQRWFTRQRQKEALGALWVCSDREGNLTHTWLREAQKQMAHGGRPIAGGLTSWLTSGATHKWLSNDLLTSQRFLKTNLKDCLLNTFYYKSFEYNNSDRTSAANAKLLIVSVTVICGLKCCYITTHFCGLWAHICTCVYLCDVTACKNVYLQESVCLWVSLSGPVVFECGPEPAVSSSVCTGHASGS